MPETTAKIFTLRNMNLSPSLESLAADGSAAKTNELTRCEAANFRWEQAVSDQRAYDYSDYVGDVATHPDWKAEHKSYLATSVHVAKDLPRSAETFTAINGPAHLNESLDNTYLLRLESIGYLFDDPLLSATAQAFWQRFYNSRKDLGKSDLPEDAELLRSEFVRLWNDKRTQMRPLFATFLNDFEGGNLDKLIKADWPHILRDRLGLTHWPSTAGKPLAVALMCYQVDEVRRARTLAGRKGAVASFTRPTVLDAEMSAAFIPAPSQSSNQSYGYTLDLSIDRIPDAFTPELLTFPIDYQPKHIKALGFISRPHALQSGHDYLQARNRHIQGLQNLSGCEGFGEVLA